MIICTSIFPDSRMFLYLERNEPATTGSTLSDRSVEPDNAKGERDINILDARKISKSPSISTLEGEAIRKYPQWIAGVGDVAGADGLVDRPQESYRRHTTSKLYSMAYRCSSNISLVSTTNVNHGRSQTLTKASRTALQRHCDFWDSDSDGYIYPWDIYRGFRRLGFHYVLCIWAAVTIAICASYNTRTSYIPHPLFVINLDNINSNRHGSSTGTYDMDGELDERRFEAIFKKYARGKEYLTLWTTYSVWQNQRCGLDFFGWFAGGLEWIAMYILLWPEDGIMTKEEVRGVFDGSMFYQIAEQREGHLYSKPVKT